jgi:threonine aldolase
MDGARLANAAVATGAKPADYGRLCDSVTQCLSKGLGCPVGTVLAGAAEYIKRARRFRKMFGGGMRQSGYLAAAGLYALEHNVERLAEDHANARRLAEGIAALPGIVLDPKTAETNIVIFSVASMPAAELVARLGAAGVLVLATGPGSIRAVTHLDVSAPEIEEAIDAFRHALGA